MIMMMMNTEQPGELELAGEAEVFGEISSQCYVFMA
jgi:hypothetical protein